MLAKDLNEHNFMLIFNPLYIFSCSVSYACFNLKLISLQTLSLLTPPKRKHLSGINDPAIPREIFPTLIRVDGRQECTSFAGGSAACELCVRALSCSSGGDNQVLCLCNTFLLWHLPNITCLASVISKHPHGCEAKLKWGLCFSLKGGVGKDEKQRCWAQRILLRAYGNVTGPDTHCLSH